MGKDRSFTPRVEGVLPASKLSRQATRPPEPSAESGTLSPLDQGGADVTALAPRVGGARCPSLP